MLISILVVILFGFPVHAKDSPKKETLDADIARLQKSLVHIKSKQGKEQQALEKSDKEVAALLLSIRTQKKEVQTEREKLEELTPQKKC